MRFWLEPANRAAFEHARQITAHYSKSFYLSAYMLPVEKRWATYAIYGFCRYADNLIDKRRSRKAEEILLEVDFLARELEVAYRTGESEHPIVLPFIVVAQRHGIPIQYPLDLLRGVQMDVEITRYRNFDELHVFCYRVAAVVGLMMTHVLGCENEEAFGYAEKLGIAMQLTNILRDIQEDKDLGRIYLPLDELEAYGCSENDILEERMTPAFRNLMIFQVNRAHSYYEQASRGIPMLARESQFAIYSASRIYRGILKRIEARDYNPFLGRVFVPEHRKLGILLQEIFRTRFATVQQSLAVAGA
ncbi:MAG: phytoene/squalene synthase family protein [candidate division KSB1 bacterium]|nr:phytoene/squalene synthase family protein [candidate division KSB1 bacterium]MDZ7304013.1 phytoene/squalene synthase family protein [candidate division KSB1 bacterium]MDZ7313277.1 phytoene/squalene synthase family protein [candidate division KSB1 bacterium]